MIYTGDEVTITIKRCYTDDGVMCFERNIEGSGIYRTEILGSLEVIKAEIIANMIEDPINKKIKKEREREKQEGN